MLRSRLFPTLVEPLAALVRSFGCPGRLFGFALAQCAAVPVDQQPTTGFHATSLYTLASSMQNGLQSGFNHLTVNRKEKQGIYNHLLKRVHLCNNYLLHTFLDDSGWAVGPLIQLEYPWLDPGGRSCHVRRKSERDHQCITWPDVAQVSHIWFHAVHSSMYAAMPKAEGFHSEGWFQPQFEIDPHKLFQHTLEQSRAACHGTKQHSRFQSRCSLLSGLLCLACCQMRRMLMRGFALCWAHGQKHNSRAWPLSKHAGALEWCHGMSWRRCYDKRSAVQRWANQGGWAPVQSHHIAGGMGKFAAQHARGWCAHVCWVCMRCAVTLVGCGSAPSNK